eukprot:TRINITY_DN6893_c0_g1_i7.p1 TRINITY_DN6893_c0_g1~~TRINITY_DN6893_c0_g1_i7.p1  ORF type:complete len:207 (+),score=17.05 TRINITY_DN6893_c0_g1_i7:344-964(+)
MTLVLFARSQLACIETTLSEARPNVRWTVVDSGRCDVPHLDVAYSIISGHVHHRLFRKDLNLYLYVPRLSSHAPAVFSAITKGEAIRTVRKCRLHSHAVAELAFLRKKLFARGFQPSDVDCHIAAAVRDFDAIHAARRNRCLLQQPPFTRPKTRKAYLKVPFTSAVDFRFLRSALRKHEHLLSCDADVAITSNKSLFRLLYKSNWR